MSERNRRQEQVAQWVERTFGAPALDVSERIARLLEEAIELAQAEGFPPALAHALVDHVYEKRPGEPLQEVGGLGVTILAYCAAVGFSADAAEEKEVARVLAIPPEYFRARQNVKADAGVALRVEP